MKRKMVPELQKGVADLDIATKPDPMSARGRAEFTHTVRMQPLRACPCRLRGSLSHSWRHGCSSFPKSSFLR